MIVVQRGTSVPVPIRVSYAGGFTLIEVMVTVAIVAILAAIALPSYADYVLRGRLVDATNALSSMRARMEQYYQDHRTYIGGPCATDSAQWAGAKAVFTFGCESPTASTYKLVATGTGVAADFQYTIDQTATMTSKVSQAWGGASYSNCWAMKRSGCL